MMNWRHSCERGFSYHLLDGDGRIRLQTETEALMVPMFVGMFLVGAIFGVSLVVLLFLYSMYRAIRELLSW